MRGVNNLRREAAGVVMNMVEAAERDDCVSARELRRLLDDVDLNICEIAMFVRGINEFVKRRARLKAMLTKNGALEVVRRLSVMTEDSRLSELRAEDAVVAVGPFSFNVFVESGVLPMVDESITKDDSGIAYCGDQEYPWSLIVSDRAGDLSAGEKLLAAVFDQVAASRTERHENMHQFFAFVKWLFGEKDQYVYRRLLHRKLKIEKLRALKAPEVIMSAEQRMLETLAGALTDDSDEWNTDEFWDKVREGARRETAVMFEGRLRSEALALMWEGKFDRTVSLLLRDVYLKRWAEEEEEYLGLDLSQEANELYGVVCAAVERITIRMLTQKMEGKVAVSRRLVRLVAMMNIDRPLGRWGA